MALEVAGWRVIGPAASVRQALDLIEAEAPEVAILNLPLRRELSTSVAEDLAARQIPFIIASGCANPEALAGKVFRDHFNVGKPVRPANLIAALRAALGRAESMNSGSAL